MRIRSLLRETEYDVLYLNSFFSPLFGVLPMVLLGLGLIETKPVVLAPRGEFSPGALDSKRWKKRAYILASQAVNLHRSVTWHVSNSYEARDVQLAFPKARCFIAGDLTAVTAASAKGVEEVVGRKEAGQLNAVFLSRVAIKKNLHGALEMLRDLRGNVQFTIYGPLESPGYWRKCEAIIESLPSNVSVRYGGIVDYRDIVQVLSQFDLFVFPTRGENFGHVIIEALSAGCPMLVSDRTPWQDVEDAGAGWVVPLEQPERFVEMMQHCVDMTGDELLPMRRQAQRYGAQKAAKEVSVDENRRLFETAAALSR